MSRNVAAIARLLEWGVDGLISNRPDMAVQVRDRFLAASEIADDTAFTRAADR